jgi:hypothetical protein
LPQSLEDRTVPVEDGACLHQGLLRLAWREEAIWS